MAGCVAKTQVGKCVWPSCKHGCKYSHNCARSPLRDQHAPGASSSRLHVGTARRPTVVAVPQPGQVSGLSHERTRRCAPCGVSKNLISFLTGDTARKPRPNPRLDAPGDAGPHQDDTSILQLYSCGHLDKRVAGEGGGGGLPLRWAPCLLSSSARRLSARPLSLPGSLHRGTRRLDVADG